MKLLVFGIGNYYKNRKSILFKTFSDEDRICAFIDNRANMIKVFEGYDVFEPCMHKELDYDYILIMSAAYLEIASQLKRLGVKENKILHFEQYLVKKRASDIYNIEVQNKKPNVLIAAYNVGYNGANIAVINLAYALIEMGYNVFVLTQVCNDRFKDEYTCDGLTIYNYFGIADLEERELNWFSQFDFAVVNTFPMISAAYKISQVIPTVWWIHEASSKYSLVYDIYQKIYNKYNYSGWMNRVVICAVSEIAKANFELYYPHTVKYIIPPYIAENSIKEEKNNKTIFAIIGPFEYLKGQDIFYDSIRKLSKQAYKKGEFWFIGSTDTRYYENLKSNLLAENIKIFGHVNQKKMNELFQQVDVVVCASREETLSLAIIEGLMAKKVCIVSDAAGAAKYIKNGKNGYVFENENSVQLSEIMDKCINKESIQQIKEEAYSTYKKNFSISSFKEKLVKIIVDLNYD